MTAHAIAHPVLGPGVTCLCGFGFDTYKGLNAHIATAIQNELRAAFAAALTECPAAAGPCDRSPEGTCYSCGENYRRSVANGGTPLPTEGTR